mmetsp:Transcript_15887/g.45666  ORF Transcript_15887/g.45666 Transcript_15887/m.45666 type:complete len:225 (-) Transcript_15887:122-796(-)
MTRRALMHAGRLAFQSDRKSTLTWRAKGESDVMIPAPGDLLAPRASASAPSNTTAVSGALPSTFSSSSCSSSSKLEAAVAGKNGSNDATDEKELLLPPEPPRGARGAVGPRNAAAASADETICRCLFAAEDSSRGKSRNTDMVAERELVELFRLIIRPPGDLRDGSEDSIAGDVRGDAPPPSPSAATSPVGMDLVELHLLLLRLLRLEPACICVEVEAKAGIED